MDDDLFQAFIMFMILTLGLAAAGFLVLRTNAEKLKVPPFVRCLLCLRYELKNSMYPKIRVAKQFSYDSGDEMEKARRKLPFLDLNLNRKMTFLKRDPQHKPHHKIAPEVLAEHGIYSITTKKSLAFTPTLQIDERRLISPIQFSPTDGISSYGSPTEVGPHGCDSSEYGSNLSGYSSRPARRRSM